MAAWVFGAAGLGFAAGVTTAVIFGVMGLVASLPGAVVVLVGRRQWSRPAVPRPVAARPVLEEATRG
jgi:hypothetical protein